MGMTVIMILESICLFLIATIVVIEIVSFLQDKRVEKLKSEILVLKIKLNMSVCFHEALVVARKTTSKFEVGGIVPENKPGDELIINKEGSVTMPAVINKEAMLAYIKERGYTWTYEEIMHEFEKYKLDYYVSATAKEIIQKFLVRWEGAE